MTTKKRDLHIFDTHAHYCSDSFDEDRDILLRSLPDKGVRGIIECATTLEDSHCCVDLARKYNYVYCAVGVHPESALESLTPSWIDDLRKQTTIEKVVAIGEIGLDYYWDNNPPKQLQLDIFEKQLNLANELELPVIIHDRNAHQDTMELLRKYRPKGVMHCFSGSAHIAKQVVNLGLYIGIGGVVTFKNARHSVEVAQSIPFQNLLLETDAPYMAPVPFRGKRNDSSLIYNIAEVIAEKRGISVESLLKQTYENALKLFNIPAQPQNDRDF